MTVNVRLSGKVAGGLSALVDDEDYEMVINHGSWCAVRGRQGTLYVKGYIRGSYTVGNTRYIYLHQLLTGFERTDHINHDGLDNRRENLRAATASQNQANRRPNVQSVSSYKGVTRHKRKWRAQLAAGGVRRTVLTDTEQAAACAYDEMAIELHGEFAVLNFPRGR